MKTSALFAFLFLAFFLNAKDAFNYQAVIRDMDGKVVPSANVSVQLTISTDIQSHQIVYQENHNTITNDFGMINLKIGLGQQVSGIFDSINWGSGSYFIRVGYDFTGGSNFVVIGSTQLLYVPYALYAKKTGGLDFENMSDSIFDNIATKLNLENQPTVLEAKVTNPDYTPIAETKDIVVYQSKSLFGIEAVLGKIAINKTDWAQFKIGENGVDGTFDITVNFNSSTFPNLLSGSYIDKIILLPWDRNSALPVPGKGWRCCVFTTKGQIYHNFPNRTPNAGQPDGTEQAGDINRWQESVLWDLPSRRLPSKTSNVFPYSQNPALPDSCYLFFPALNQDNGYGNGGFGESITQHILCQQVNFPRFYIHKRANQTSPVSFMGGFETSHKIQIIGSYSSNISPETTSRICVFVTTDGGRQWYNKYEFATDMPNAFGNALIGDNINGDYAANSFALQKRNFIIPSVTVKDPINHFFYGPEISIISIVKSGSLVLNTSVAHGLVSGDLIVIKKKLTTSTNYEFLCNDNINAINGGNGKIWKVEVLSLTSIRLYEYVHNPNSNIPARHIHAINRVKDGFLISTGEVYPQAWILYLQLKSSDTYAPVFAYENFNFLRLNSTESSVQRTLGIIMMDDADQTIAFASDEATVSGAQYSIRPNKSITRSSTGVYKGKLTDIDDFSKFACIYEAEQVAFHFKEINGMWIFGGQQGELAISTDKGATWRKFKITGDHLEIRYPKGIDHLGRYYLDQVIIYRK